MLVWSDGAMRERTPDDDMTVVPLRRGPVVPPRPVKPLRSEHLEEVLLGRLMWEPTLFERVTEALFTRYQRVFRVLAQRVGEGCEMGPLEGVEVLRDAGHLEDVGGPSRVLEWVEEAKENVPDALIRRLSDLARRRQLVAVAETVRNAAEEPGEGATEALEVAREQFDAVMADARVSAPVSRFTLVSGNAILDLPPPLWLIPRFLQRNSTAVLYGPSGAGKSFIVLDLALHLAAGLPWHVEGEDCEPQPVVYVAAEGGAGLGIRCRAWCSWHHRQLPPAFSLLTDAPDLYSANTDVRALVDAIRAHYGASNPALVIIDTLSRVMVGGEQNSNDDMGMVVTRCEVLQREFGATVCLVHHSTKADAETERGGGALKCNVDTTLLVTADGSKSTMVSKKQRNAPTEETLRLELHPVELPGVEYGSCVVLPAGTKPTTGRDEQEHSNVARSILVEQFEGRVSSNQWKQAFIARTGKSESTFWRAHAALKVAKRVKKDGRYWVAVTLS